MVNKSYCNDEPYLIAIELKQRGTFIIRVYMKENMKNHILDQLVKLLKRIRCKYPKPNILVYGDFNTNPNWKIELIKNLTNLTCPELNNIHN